MLTSLRYGFATNSSSSHSVIFHSTAERTKSYTPTGFLPTVNHSPYGSSIPDRLVLTSAEDKLHYFLFCMRQLDQFGEFSSHDLILIAKEAEKHGITDLRLEEIRKIDIGYADSNLIRPRNVPLSLWISFLLDPRVVLECHYDSSEFVDAHILHRDVEGILFKGGSRHRMRQDGDAIAFFDAKSGTKARWSRSSYDKSSSPELVDVKITDYCGHGCRFCYQGSTKRGKHAPLERIEEIFAELSDIGVFEVAMGGGEPITHPDFPAILRAAQKYGLTPNFTTYGIGWAQRMSGSGDASAPNPDFREDIVSTLRDLDWTVPNGLGVSVHTARDVAKAVTLREALRKEHRWNTQVMAQTVVGATSLRATAATLEQCIGNSMPMLMLGFKTTGRGASYRQRSSDRDEMLKILSRASDAAHNEIYDRGRFALSVDTAFLDSHSDILDEMGVPSILRSSPEGRFSMYIDAVSDTVAASSYCGPEGFTPRQPGEIRAQFARY